MKRLHALAGFFAILPLAASAQPSLTIYNQDYAVVRERVPLDLKAGVNTVSFSGVTDQLEPDSVVLRDPTGKNALNILEQSFRSDALLPSYLLSLNEGKTLDFIVKDKDNREYTVKGKIIRSGFSPNGSNAPVIEVDGQLRFSLPGEPVFPALGEDAILQPTIFWKIAADKPEKFDAELDYTTKGLQWSATYNLVLPVNGDDFDILGWLTIQNNSGKEFRGASIQLIAGNVNHSQEYRPVPTPKVTAYASDLVRPVPQQRGMFDDFHLYTLPNAVDLRERETKQVKFVSASDVKADKFFVYDGFSTQNLGTPPDQIRFDKNYGTQSNNQVWIMREFDNSQENGLGLALPAGILRFYRQDSDNNSLQFVGEDSIGHTPAGERVVLYTGDAFDLIGQRTRTDYQLDEHNKTMQESFEIKLRNHKTQPVEIRVIEHLYRWVNWSITAKSDDYTKTDAQTVEFHVTVKPDEEKTLTYTVHYDWK